MEKEQSKEEVKDITRIDSYEFDERFYQKIIDKQKVFAPSVTYILGAVYPTDFGFINWIGDVGNKRAEEIRDEAGEDGSFVHDSIDQIINGKKISSDTISTMFKPARSLKVKRCLQSFLDWVEEYQPKFIENEYIIWNDNYNYAGTVDLLCEITEDKLIKDGDSKKVCKVWVDFKTSRSIHTSHKVQLTAYHQGDHRATFKDEYIAILHLGNTTKKKYSFNTVDLEKELEYWEQFKTVNKMFQLLNPVAHPTTETFPEYFKIGKRIKEK